MMGFEERARGFCAEVAEMDQAALGHAVSLEAVQDLVAAAVRLYVAKLATREESVEIPLPCRSENELSDTEIAIMAGKLLESADIDVFELQMWRTLGRDA